MDKDTVQFAGDLQKAVHLAVTQSGSLVEGEVLKQLALDAAAAEGEERRRLLGWIMFFITEDEHWLTLR